jgi:tyrosine-protein phosphatase YwqE
VVTTPHLLLPHLTSDAAIDRQLEQHRVAFDRLLGDLEGTPDLPAVGLGQEIWAPDAALLRRVASRPDVGLAGSRWLLVEFGFDLQGTHEGVVREAISSGRGIVIAHPERYRYLPGVDPVMQMGRWRELGAVLQVNAGSFTGHYRSSSPDSERLRGRWSRRDWSIWWRPTITASGGPACRPGSVRGHGRPRRA